MRALLLTLSARTPVTVVYPEECEHELSTNLPDLVLRSASTGRIVRLFAIETRCSLTRPWPERWHELATIAHLTIIVPKGMVRDVERLLLRTDARIVEYERGSAGEIVFTPPL
ncbi:MAG: hypothetical protein M5U28_21125 [Sandaracinaceae bacterium]|nr:hypothetical protein [Sandaracinaceae bacterium]